MSSIVAVLVVGLVVPLFMRWYQKGSYQEGARQLNGDAHFIMKPTRRHKIVVVGLLAFLATFGILVVLFASKDAGVGWLFSAMSLLFAPFVLPTLLRRIEVSPTGMRAFSPWTGTTEILWKDVARVWFRKWGQTLRVRGQDGHTIMVPSYLSGLKQLERQLVFNSAAAGAADAFQALRKHQAAL